MNNCNNGVVGVLTPTLVMDKPRKWTRKYKKSINCKRPRGFSQKQYCKGRGLASPTTPIITGRRG